MKIAINKCFGGYSLSLKAMKRLAELKGREVYFYTGTLYGGYRRVDNLNTSNLFILPLAKDLGDWVAHEDLPSGDDMWFDNCRNDRTDPDLIKVVEEMGAEANGACANLEIMEIPDDVDYEIQEYDGQEWVAERHRTWG